MSIQKLFIFLTIFILALPGNVALAINDTSTLESLTHQITALQKYIDRVTLSLQPKGLETMAHADMRNTINSGIDWIVQSQEDTGHFAYEYLPYSDEYKNGDNIVRQAGTLYALSEVARRDDSEVAERSRAIEKAIGFFEGISPEHIYEGEKVQCVAKNENSETCMLGATALALSGILGYVESDANKADEYEDIIEGYVSFILASKKEGTGFRDKYRIGIGFMSQESSFSNGEALLALVRYYQYSPRVDVKEVIDDTFVYLKDTEFDTPLYLWAMAALKDMQVLWPNEAYTNYGEKYTSWRLDRLYRNHGTIRNYCASTEGLASAYSLIKGSAPEAMLKRLRAEIDFWNAKNADLQIRDEDVYRLAANEGDTLALQNVTNMEQSRGGFLTAENELTQRIDFTQHCVTTYVQTLVDIDGEQL